MLHAEALCKTFPTPTGGQTCAVDGLSFTVPAGQIYGLLGPNGAGKTTTLRMLSGLIRPTSGRALINGYDVVTEPEQVKRSIGFLTANTGLYQRLSPRELLTYFGELHGMDAPVAKARADALIEWLNMGEFAHLRCEESSPRMRFGKQAAQGANSTDQSGQVRGLSRLMRRRYRPRGTASPRS